MDDPTLPPEGGETNPPPVPTWPPFWDLPPDSRPAAEVALGTWVALVLKPAFPELTDDLKQCWSHPGHSGCIAILRGLKAKLDAAYAPPLVKGKPGAVGAAPVNRVPDLAIELDRLREIFRITFKRCGPPTGCYYASRPAHVALGAAQDAAATRAYWGHDLPDLPSPSEPWRVGADLAAEARASARTEGAEGMEEEVGADESSESW